METSLSNRGDGYFVGRTPFPYVSPSLFFILHSDGSSYLSLYFHFNSAPFNDKPSRSAAMRGLLIHSLRSPPIGNRSGSMQKDESNASNKGAESAALSSDSFGSNNGSDEGSIKNSHEDTVFFVYSKGGPTAWNAVGPVIQDKPLCVNGIRKEVSVTITNSCGEVIRMSIHSLLDIYFTLL
jgi:hypothetical protein